MKSWRKNFGDCERLLAKFKCALIYLYHITCINGPFQISFVSINVDENFARAFGACNNENNVNMVILYQHPCFTILKTLTNWLNILECVAHFTKHRVILVIIENLFNIYTTFEEAESLIIFLMLLISL